MTAPNPTVPTAADKFYQPGTTQILKLPTVTGSSPTLAQVTAGTVVSNDCCGVTGWTVSTADLPTKDFSERFVGSLPGDITPDASSLDFWADATGADMSAVFTQDEQCWIYIVWGGVTDADTLTTLYKVRVSSIQRPLNITDVSKLTVAFSQLVAPVDGTLPTS